MKNKKAKGTGRVREMASAHPSAIDVAASTKTAGEKLRRLGTKRFPVVKDDRVVGKIDDPNPDRAVARYGHDPASTSIGEMGLGQAVYCFEDQTPGEARKIMIEQGVEHMPVVDRELRIVGIISLKSLDATASGSSPKRKKRKAA